ncbi:hypothetical protein BU15DRAFT_19815, partial [Melanogaster broomeanus]
FTTSTDSMGLFRVYPTRPTLFPTGEADLAALVDAPTLEQQARVNSDIVTGLPQPESIKPEDLYSAFSSPTAGLLMCWQYSGSTSKSVAELNRLWSFIQDPLFDPKAHEGF